MGIFNPPAIQPLRTVTAPEEGGTGLSELPEAGEVLIGTSDGTYVLAKLTAGSGITITSNSGEIIISSSGGGGGKQREPLVAAGFNGNIPYLDTGSYTPDFITTTTGDIVIGA